ncbi:MAG: anti-sigma factor [Dermatophilaceae bacterium]|nr:zf-HC2 domain-containing protein [Intrasporangiaceae bacterium]
MTCNHAHLDGAYVLGALAPSERLDFSQHLADCAECSQSVRELAGLPGLLAQIEVTDLEPVLGPALPPTLLPSLVREVRRSQRRRSALVAAVAASAAALATSALTVGGALGDPGTTNAPTTAVTATPAALPMLAVGPAPVRADVLVSSVAWGTRLDLTCSYESEEDEEEYGASPAAEYALVVRTRDGNIDRVATWRGLPGRTMRLSAATATSRSDIESVEVHTVDGAIVLRVRI